MSALRATATDNTYTTGNPGIGYNYGCDGTYANFTWENFLASDGQPGGFTFGGKHTIVGTIHLRVIRDPETQESKGFAFLDAPNAEEMHSIIRRFDRAPLEDRLLRANVAQPPRSKGLQEKRVQRPTQ